MYVREPPALRKIMSTGPGWAKTIFRKVFENEENHHNLTSGQLKYKSSLIWMKSVHKCEMSEKCPQGQGGGKLQFFHFFEKFLKI